MKTLFKVDGEMQRSADISPCGQYRWRLGRTWDEELPDIGWIMLNPSTADAMQDDPTIRTVIAFSRIWGYGTAIIRNLFSYRSTDRRGILKMADPVGDHGMSAVLEAAACHRVIAAWGKLDKKEFSIQAEAVVRAVLATGKSIQCLGTNADGTPWHPLYRPHNLQPVMFSSPGEKGGG